MIHLPVFDPVALNIPIPYVGDLPIRWYALAYIGGFLLGHRYLLHLVAKHPVQNLTKERVENLFIYIVLGVILGGRFGFVLFYHLPYFIQHPLHIFYTWQGGMSFHGGILGVTIAGLLFCWKHKIHPADVGDRLAIVVPIGLLLGRIANFINGELWGRPTDLPWAMVFPTDPTQLPRHPSQLYEAGLEGVLLLTVLWFISRKTIRRWQPMGIFILGYGLARFTVEFVRQPEEHLYLEGFYLTSGQWLSVPMLLVGTYILFIKARKTNLK
ncbi:MAG: prolipoprotein diacylglyceryl transferase [Alphaproteobacteria bacterium]|nr:prolipoprotein diacylglyceryl transferase [Alphaproteobacteria bacterium]MDD9919435.1 prolipoprotein diacylglyceryl transferase [Alphaproteobacteria bacterium]